MHKCREHDRTFEEVFGENNNNDSGTAPVSWAAIVKGKGGLGPDLTIKRDKYARQIRELNEKKAKDKRDAEERKEAELAEQERLRTVEEERRSQIVKEDEQQRAMDEEKEHQNDATRDLNDEEENLRLITALAQPSLGGSRSDEELLDQEDHKGDGVDVAQSAENEGEEQSEFPPSLDSSLETVFGPGATMLAKELENNSDKRDELKTSEAELNSDSEVELVNVSSPAKDQRKKRVRNNIKVGELGSIRGIKDNSCVSSEGENSEETTKEVKKPRLGGESSESETLEKDNIHALENRNVILEENTNHSEELAEEMVEDKDHHTEGLEEEGGILKVLLDMHEGVPLEDPGPIIASVDRAEGAAGATQ